MNGDRHTIYKLIILLWIEYYSVHLGITFFHQFAIRLRFEA